MRLAAAISDETAPGEVALADIPQSRKRAEVERFAATFDGGEWFGDSGSATLERLRRQWDVEQTLPWQLDDLRGWLALEVRSERLAEPASALTVGGATHRADRDVRRMHARDELRKAAIVDRIRALVVCRERRLPMPTAGRPLRTLIPRTPMLERYLTMKPRQGPRWQMAQDDLSEPGALAADFGESVERFGAYSNIDERFYSRTNPPPKPGSDLWKTDDVTGRLIELGELTIEGRAGNSHSGGSESQDLPWRVAYVDREIVAARTRATKPTHRMQGVELVRHDVLLRSLDAHLPVIGEIKTPTDQDAYYALIQLLAAASQLASPAQTARLHKWSAAGDFAEPGAKPRLDLALMFVDPDRCGRIVERPSNKPQYRAKLDAAAPRIAERILRHGEIATHVRRIFRIDLALVRGQLHAELAWAFEASV